VTSDPEFTTASCVRAVAAVSFSSTLVIVPVVLTSLTTNAASFEPADRLAV